MDFDYPSDDVALGRELARWLRAHVPPDWRTHAPPGSEEWFGLQREWDRSWYAGGWAQRLWPVEHGGVASTRTQRVLIADLLAAYGAPDGLGKVGKRLVAPVVMKYGSPELQERLLGPILRGEELWCQGFSEPGAGSDLGALRTRATEDGDGLVVTGQKVWTSFAQWADWCLLLVRTGADGDRRKSVSMLAVRMDSPGIDVRPLEQINGAADFNEVFFDEVVVPRANVVGEVGRGWDVAMALLADERGAEMGFGQLSATSVVHRDLVASLAGRHGTAEELVVGRLLADALATRVLATRLALGGFSDQDPGAISSLMRLQATVAASEALTEAVLTTPPDTLLTTDGGHALMAEWLSSRSWTIAGGTAEIQRSTIARRLLELR